MGEEETTRDIPNWLSKPGFFRRGEPVIFTTNQKEIERVANELKKLGSLSLDEGGHLIDVLGTKSTLAKGDLARQLADNPDYIDEMSVLSEGTVSEARDAGSLVLKRGLFYSEDSQKQNLVVAFRHIGQREDIDFFVSRLGKKHVPATETLVIPSKQGPTTLVIQEKVVGKPLNEIKNLVDLTDAQRSELLSLLDAIQQTYEETGRFPDLHGKPLGIKPEKLWGLDVRHTPNIIVDESGAFLVDTDDLGRRHTEETFIGWLGCKATAGSLRGLKRKLE